MQDSLPFLDEKLREEEIRDFLLTLIIKACNHPNEEIAHKAVQCLIDMFRGCYAYLTMRHMEVLVDQTMALLKSRSTSIAIAITEFWNTVAKYESKLERKKKVEEKTVIHYFMPQVAEAVTKELLLTLLKRDDEDIESGMSLHGATYNCLISINDIAGDAIKGMNLEFIDKLIESEERANKVAALLCFQAMILGSRQDVSQLICSSILTVFKFITVDQVLCKSALKLIHAIAVKYPIILLKDALCVEWLEVLMKLLQGEDLFCALVCEVLSSNKAT